MPKRKENFAASFLSQPNKSAKEIVTPDLDTPSIIAKALLLTVINSVKS